MNETEVLFGRANIFPAIAPLVVLIMVCPLEYALRDTGYSELHLAATTIATMLIYSLLFFPVLSYLAFKYAILPFLRVLPQATKSNGYLTNCGLLLASIYGLLTVYFGVADWKLSMAICLYVALNFLGHFAVNSLIRRYSR